MKCTESRELRDLSMNQLNAKLSELYKELPSGKWTFQRKYRQHILNTEGKFHLVHVDKIWVEKEDMPQNKE